ncbi:hypothetical protein D3C83_34960 [compost metagenome]
MLDENRPHTGVVVADEGGLGPLRADGHGKTPDQRPRLDAAIARHHDVDTMAEADQRSRKRPGNVGEAARLGERGCFRGHHQDAHHVNVNAFSRDGIE